MEQSDFLITHMYCSMLYHYNVYFLECIIKSTATHIIAMIDTVFPSR